MISHHQGNILSLLLACDIESSIENVLIISHFPPLIHISYILFYATAWVDYHFFLREWFHGNCKGEEVCYGWILMGGYNKVSIEWSMIYLSLFPPWGLELRSEFFMFDLVSAMSNVLLRWCSWRAVMRMLRGLSWGVIMSTKTILLLPNCPHTNFMEVPWGD